MPLSISTTCPYCGVGCGVLARPDDAAGFRISGDPDHPANFGQLCSKGTALADTLDLDDRLLRPQVRGRETDWDTAIAAVADGFRRIAEAYGPQSVAFYVSGQLLTEDYYVANKLMKGYIGAANIDTNSRLCMASAVAGHQRAFGADAVPGCFEDLELADLIVLVGSNTAWCHPIVYRRLQAAKAARPDIKVVVIDPRRTATADGADLHLPLAPGSDVALFNGLLAFLDRAGCVDRDFLAQHSSGAEDALAAAHASAPDLATVAAACRLPEQDLGAFYRWFVAADKTVTLFSQGVNQSSAGTDKVNAIINCHLYTGRVGQPGAGPFSLTGQPNAMGGREVGGMASTLAAHLGFEDADTVQRFWGSPTIARAPGLKAVELFEAIGDGRVKALWFMATNPLVSLPDADSARRALGRCELVVASDCMDATDSLAYADIKLPALAWGEKDGTVTNSERRISRQRAFLPAPDAARPDWRIICDVAKRMGYADFDYRHPHEIFAEHARLSAFENDGARVFDIGGLADLTRAQYDGLEPIQWPVVAVPTPSPPVPGERAGERGLKPRPPLLNPLPPSGGRGDRNAGRGSKNGSARLFADGRFATPDGRARFIALTPRAPANPPDVDYPLVLNTGRVRDHWHSMTRTAKSPRLCGHIGEPMASVHPEDARQHGLQQGEIAELQTRWGRMTARVAVDDAQAPGNVFVPIHWSGQNASAGRVGALVNPVVDPLSGEPEFKHTPLQIRPLAAGWHGFLLARQRLAIGAENGLAYWVRIKGARFWRFELASQDSPGDWAPWARRILGAAAPDADWLEYRDQRAGSYRVASLRQDALHACLFVAPAPPELPARAWLAGLFAKQSLDADDRMALLAGQPRDPSADSGEQVCACFGVGRNTLLKAIREQGLQTAGEVGEHTQAGSNCGSCLPEIQQLLAAGKA